MSNIMVGPKAVVPKGSSQEKEAVGSAASAESPSITFVEATQHYH